MMKDINLTWKADGDIDSYTIYRSTQNINVNELPEPLVTGLTVKEYTDTYNGEDLSLFYRIASVKGDRKKISGEYIVEIGGSDIPSNEMHFTTLAGTIDYYGVVGDQIVLNDGTSITLDEEYLHDIAAPAGKHKVVLKERREVTYVGIGGEALVELHNFPTLISVDTFNTSPNYNSLNLVKVPTVLPSNIRHLDWMFNSATSFNQDISMWDTSNVTSMAGMFYSATSFNQDLSSWCVALITTMPTGFDGSASAWTLPRPVWGTCPRGENAQP